jgi:DNA adenine methylase
LPQTESPLRYPGGKSSLYLFVQNIIELNDLNAYTYVEPFVGGAGLALKLLLHDDVPSIIINDIDPAIFSFWYCVLNRADDLCSLIESTPITMHEWYMQKEILAERGNGDLLSLAFSTLFLNRTNVSGVLKGGVIGGQDQTGNYKIDARFKKEELIRKIQNIAQHKNRILLFNLDVLDFVFDTLPTYNNLFVNFDPPYVNKGAELYMNFFNEDDHVVLQNAISNYDGRWMVTYNDCSLIRRIYQNYQRCLIPINYSAGSTKKTKEIGIFSDGLVLPDSIQII